MFKKKLPPHAKKQLEEDDISAMKRKPMAAACKSCKKGHAGVNGDCKGKGYGMKGAKGA